MVMLYYTCRLLKYTVRIDSVSAWVKVETEYIDSQSDKPGLLPCSHMHLDSCSSHGPPAGSMIVGSIHIYNQTRHAV